MNANRDKPEQDELVLLREQVVALEKRLAALEAAVEAKIETPRKSPVLDVGLQQSRAEEIPWLVITAAVAAVVKQPFSIAGIQLQGMPPLNVWAFEGRRAIFYSHQVRSN